MLYFSRIRSNALSGPAPGRLAMQLSSNPAAACARATLKRNPASNDDTAVQDLRNYPPERKALRRNELVG
jgi:hypothetical protein